ncbi:MAG: Coenzyme F420:L-glutamate ligase [Promethearchaeota archaeon]|nr:MAG: Coenzyme F420:L-glutamate ligase [Candidatus Lokiarchaeota archaeon]
MTEHIQIIGLQNIPKIKKGDNIAQIILETCKNQSFELQNLDIILIAQTIITKSLGRIRDLKKIEPSLEAQQLYEKVKPLAEEKRIPIKTPHLIQAILEESARVLKAEHVIITETKHGFICANAGIDKSNIEGETKIGLLPIDCDEEAQKICKKIKAVTRKQIAIIITDSFGRPFRRGAVGVALGVAGILPIKDQRGKKDLFGNILQSTIIGQGDNLAAAAQLIMGEADEGLPIIIIRGYRFKYDEDATISSLLRSSEEDIFRPSSTEFFRNILKKRRSYKLPFLQKEVPKKIIKNCIEMSRWAPSAHNSQPWRYLILEKDSMREQLIDEMNKKLECDLSKEGKSKTYIKRKIEKTRSQFLESPFLILLCLDTLALEEYSDEERNNNEYLLGLQGVSAAATYLLLSFEILGLSACWYCAPLFAKDIVKKVIRLPKHLDPMAFFTVGYGIESNVKTPFRKGVKDIIINI